MWFECSYVGFVLNIMWFGYNLVVEVVDVCIMWIVFFFGEENVDIRVLFKFVWIE